MRKPIVKGRWLSFLKSLSPAEQGKLESSLLSGEDEAISASTLRKLAPEERAFVAEKLAQIQGRPAQILVLAKALVLAESLSSAELTNERRFLKGFSLMRLGRSAEAGFEFKSLPREFSARIQIEQGIERLNRGDFTGARTLFQKSLDGTDSQLDPFSACTLYGAWTLALIHQGEFKEAEGKLSARKRILKVAPSTILSAGTRLYEFLLMLERNDFAQASRFLEKNLAEEEVDSVNAFFLKHLEVRLYLAKNELEGAGQALKTLKATAERLKLPLGVLDFRLEEIEWNLRSGRGEAVMAQIAEVENEASKDEFLRFRLELLKAQAYAQKSDTASALKAISIAIERGENRIYRPGLVWAYFHAAGIELAGAQPLRAKVYLARGRSLAGQLGLRAREACFSYMSEVIENRYASASGLIGLARHQEIGPELEYFLDTYRLLDSVEMAVDGRDKHEMITEPRLRRLLFQNPGVFWFQREAILVSNLGSGRVHSIEFPTGSPLLSGFRLLWSALAQARSGFSLKDLHKARSPHAYRDDLHAGATKMLISRLRDKLAVAGLKIIYDRDQGLYNLSSSLATFTIQSGPARGAPEIAKRDRGLEILERIAMEPFVSTQDLCREFGVSRQALHPFLKRLVETGQIRVVKRGPVSGYIFRG